MDDLQLNQLLDCDTEDQFVRALIRFRPDDAAALSIREGEKWLRRRVVRRTDYAATTDRISRESLGFTWTELRIMRWAFESTHSESKKQPTVEYIASLLARPVEQVARQINTKNGIQGFKL